jgi:hypothetical protein
LVAEEPIRYPRVDVTAVRPTANDQHTYAHSPRLTAGLFLSAVFPRTNGTFRMKRVVIEQSSTERVAHADPLGARHPPAPRPLSPSWGVHTPAGTTAHRGIAFSKAGLFLSC